MKQGWQHFLTKTKDLIGITRKGISSYMYDVLCEF
jgi:hypothetical protein